VVLRRYFPLTDGELVADTGEETEERANTGLNYKAQIVKRKKSVEQ
jgi:hypothetical protein